MPLLVFLNERSCASECGADEVAAGMREFVAVLKELRRWRDISLATQSPLPESELARGYYFAQWRNDARNKEEFLFIQAMRNRRTTFQAALHASAAADRGDVWHRHGGADVQGLGAARMADGLAVSLPLDPVWDACWLDLAIEELTEDPDTGDVRADEYTERVRHASRVAHLGEHEEWGRAEGLDAVSCGAELWAGRADFFPDLQFLPHVRDDLENLDPKWFKGARRLLRQLQETAAAWDPVSSPTGPHWEAPRIRPEHETARRDRYWDDLDGESRCFELHGNLNRDAGRVYFRLVHEEKAIRIAHIGRHL
ncbi:hypothetical protein [Streptomyces edwardsiae]|uniref:DUF1963 domain-containing protein n=2 Tax=Streptomyces TaxID=1883 RepID=A0ABU2QFL6_9ACTN|nr:hypothetical protein [Streptomyces sp. DSM 41635]MDT0402694.1 hypothetical protein [Streptomyces sp. DSM 41635]